MLTRLIVITLLLATACTSKPVETASSLPDRPGTTEKTVIVATAIPSPVFEPEDEVQKRLTQMVIDDLATRLAVNAELIRVVSIEPTVWRDASFGCPLDDKVYAPQQISGFRIRLNVEGQDYVYHTDRTNQIILCLEAKPDEPGLR